ncbi:rCG63428, partial [Rattus norvegicus]
MQSSNIVIVRIDNSISVNLISIISQKHAKSLPDQAIPSWEFLSQVILHCVKLTVKTNPHT